jgi:hypothetical protein
MNGLICGAGAYGCFKKWADLRPELFLISGFTGLVATAVLWGTHNSVIRVLDDYKPKTKTGAENGNG